MLHVSLANYAAGAIMMPYGRFLKACQEMRYSIHSFVASSAP